MLAGIDFGRAPNEIKIHIPSMWIALIGHLAMLHYQFYEITLV